MASLHAWFLNRNPQPGGRGWGTPFPRGQWKQVRWLAASVFALLLAPGALAADVAVLLSQATEPYASFYNALVANLPSQSGVLLNRAGDGSSPPTGKS